RFAGRAYRITAEIVIPAAGKEGVIVAQGGRQGGFTLYVEQGRVVYETTSFGHSNGAIVSSEPLGTGKATVVVEVTPTGRDQGGQAGTTRFAPSPVLARLTVNGKPAGEARLAAGTGGETLDIGADLVSPVSPKYASPFAFTGKIDSVTVDLR